MGKRIGQKLEPIIRHVLEEMLQEAHSSLQVDIVNIEQYNYSRETGRLFICSFQRSYECGAKHKAAIASEMHQDGAFQLRGRGFALHLNFHTRR